MIPSGAPGSAAASEVVDMETLKGFPSLPAMGRDQQSWPATHAIDCRFDSCLGNRSGVGQWEAGGL